MPILPLDHPEPFAATLGVMLYPGTEASDAANARAFAAQWLGEPLRRFHEAGHRLSYEVLMGIVVDAGRPLSDLDERSWGGTATGELVKVYFALACRKPELASWSNAVRIAELTARRCGKRGARTEQWAARRRFLLVAHLWGAWSIREGKFEPRPEVGYDGFADFQSFLTEAEILRDWGQTRRPRRARSKPPLPAEVWRVPDSWRPPERLAGWPETGRIPLGLTLPDELLAGLRPAGRPSRVS
jgi:hypothetical protein